MVFFFFLVESPWLTFFVFFLFFLGVSTKVPTAQSVPLESTRQLVVFMRQTSASCVAKDAGLTCQVRRSLLLVNRVHLVLFKTSLAPVLCKTTASPVLVDELRTHQQRKRYQIALHALQVVSWMPIQLVSCAPSVRKAMHSQT